MTAVTEPRIRPPRRSPLRGGRLYVWMVAFALIAGVLSLAFPWTPSYDPWSWLIWGREILHGKLTIAGGSSWKPLPVLFTTVFALFGPAQPRLWLIVARAGALLASMMAAKLTARITWGLVSRGRPGVSNSSSREWLAGLSPLARAGALAAPVLAATLALLGTGFTPTYPVPMMLGYSEGFTFALALIAIERAFDGHHRQAFLIGMLPCLDRPELWFIWGPYGLWMIWRERRDVKRALAAGAAVLGLIALMLALWVVPQVLGGRKAGGLISHARHNHSVHSAVNSAFPFWTELSRTIWPLVIGRVEAAALLLIAVTAWLLVRDRRGTGSWREAVKRDGAPAAAALAAAAGFCWWIGISLETQAGFAGNTRYTILGVLLVYVGGASAYAWAAIGVARLLGRAWRRGGGAAGRRRQATGAGMRQATGAGLRQAPSAGMRLGGASALMTLVFLFVPGWFAHRLPSVESVRLALRYQAELRQSYVSLIKRAGGPGKVLACGSIMTDNYEVTMLAWYLDEPIPRVNSLPHTLQTGRGPNVVFQAGPTSYTPGNLGPTPLQMATWERGWQASNGSRYRILTAPPVTLYMDCSAPGPG